MLKLLAGFNCVDKFGQRQNMIPPCFQKLQLPFKIFGADRILTKDIDFADIVIHDNRHGIFIGNGTDKNKKNDNNKPKPQKYFLKCSHKRKRRLLLRQDFFDRFTDRPIVRTSGENHRRLFHDPSHIFHALGTGLLNNIPDNFFNFNNRHFLRKIRL